MSARFNFKLAMKNALGSFFLKERARIGDYTSLPSDSQQMVFSDYIHKLLDAIYLSLKKLMYGLQLLRLSRSIRQGGSKGQSSANENTKVTNLLNINIMLVLFNVHMVFSAQC